MRNRDGRAGSRTLLVAVIAGAAAMWGLGGAAANAQGAGRVVVTLRDGRVVEGVLLDFGRRTYRIERPDGTVEKLSERTVREVRFVGGAASQPAASPTPLDSATVREARRRAGAPRTGTPTQPPRS